MQAQVSELPPGYKAYRLVRSRQFKEALGLLDAILATEPNRADLWVNRGVALQAMFRLDEAVASFSRALLCRPDDTGALINRGAVRGWQGRYLEALKDYDRAVALSTDDEAARLGRSVILSSLGRFKESLEDVDCVLGRNPGSGGAHYNRALVRLSLGDYAEGFREHEWRFGTNAVLGRHRFPQPVWLGQKTNKRILVHCEQGLGDSLQFCRYLPFMKGLDAVIEAPKALVRLFEQFGFPVIKRDDPLPAFDFHLPMMSLGAIFSTTLGTVPFRDKYLSAEGEWPGISILPGKKVGLSWTSGVRPEQPIAVAMQHRKSIPPGVVKPLLDVPGVSWVSLQKDYEEKNRLDGLIDPMPAVTDFADTARIVKDLDLVITVDSAVAHLAGAMGKPVWVLNRFDICWRWLSGDVQSPWYETAKVYRQSEPGRWDDVIASVKSDLMAFV